MKVTTDHQEIKLWAEARKGQPEVVDDPEAGSDLPVLRLDFPGKEDDVFLGENPPKHVVSWAEFFRHFDAQQLAFQYDEDSRAGDPSWDYRFTKRNQVSET